MNATDLAAEVLGLPATELAAVRIKGGLTNESWLVAGDGHQVVVRLSRVDEQAMQIDRVSEARVLRAVEQAGIGAPVLLCSPARRALVTRWLGGRTLTLDAARTPHTATRLAQLLKRLHSMPAPAAVHRTDLAKVLTGYWATLDDGSDSRREDAPERARAREIAVESSERSDYCLCHNDVHHLNVIDDGRQLWLLDWEYGGIGDPFFDLASVACSHAYDAELRATLLRAYGVSDEAQRFDRMCWLFDYIRDLWLAVRACSADELSVTEF